MNVRFATQTLDYLEELVTILYQKGYFSWLDTSEKYVDELVCDIIITLPLCPHKPAPKYFARYGKNMYYAAFRKNKQTTWYAFFSKYNDNGNMIYLVRYIANNHIVAQHLR